MRSWLCLLVLSRAAQVFSVTPGYFVTGMRPTSIHTGSYKYSSFLA